MSYLSAEACTQWLAAGRGDEYPSAAATAAALAQYGMAKHWTGLLCIAWV